MRPFFLCLLFALSAQAAPRVAVYLEGFDYLEAEEDRASLDKLIGFALRDYSDHPVIAEKVISLRVQEKDRRKLYETFLKISEDNDCKDNSRNAGTCRLYRGLWVDQADSIHFYEDSAGKLESARRLMTENECANALLLLREVESREGTPFRPVLEMQLRCQSLLKNKALTEELGRSLESLRLF